ncbi:MAG TPA: Gfo/Idh/MocA family oxidoreductase [Spirochaetia bacterium]|nr:Gfo/Idh/MocA family oxidoreductase [Spirochaetia bacterium]
MVNFGIIGTGMIARHHAKVISKMSGGKVVACCSRSQDSADAFGKEYGCRGYSELEAMLEHPGLDAVSICSPSGAHLEPALKAAESGKHAMIEKPLEITLSRCDRIIEAFKEKKLKLGVIFQSRFFDATSVIKDAIDAGRFGTLTLGDAYVKWYRNQDYYDKGGWKGTRKLDGGGALMNQSIHAIDVLQWFMGPVESVQAYTDTLGHTGIEVEDVGVAVLRFKNGALGVIEGTTAAFPGFLKRIEISGTQGTAILEEENLTHWKFAEEREEDGKIRERYMSATNHGGGAADPGAIGIGGHRKQFEDFARAIEQGQPLALDGSEARKSVEIILAVYRSAREGGRITLPLRE